MGLLVHAWGAYRSYTVPPQWRSEDYQINLMVKVAKGEQTSSRQNVRGVDGQVYAVSATQPQAGLAVFGMWAAARLRQLGITDAVLVPVPASDHIELGQPFAGRRLAETVAQYYGVAAVVAAPILAFERVMPKASKNEKDSRNQYILKAALKIDSTASLRGRTAVLVDDVLTLGGHLKACASYLREHGLIVEHALCVGRTVKEEHPTPLSLAPEEIDPDNPFDF